MVNQREGAIISVAGLRIKLARWSFTPERGDSPDIIKAPSHGMEHDLRTLARRLHISSSRGSIVPRRCTHALLVTEGENQPERILF